MGVIPYEIPLGTAKIGPRFEFKCPKKKIKTENTVLPSNRPPYSFFSNRWLISQGYEEIITRRGYQEQQQT